MQKTVSVDTTDITGGEYRRAMPFPSPGTGVPLRGNRFSKYFARAVFRLMGWKLEGNAEFGSKALLTGAPHTSNRDFIIAWLVWTGIGADMKYVVKDSYDQGLGKPFVRWSGGIPVNRSKRTNFVDQMVRYYKERDSLIVAIMPEGTRSPELRPVTEWKSGFYHIARQADIPLIPIYFGSHEKRLVIGDPIPLTGDQDVDYPRLQAFYDAQHPASS